MSSRRIRDCVAVLVCTALSASSLSCASIAQSDPEPVKADDSESWTDRLVNPVSSPTTFESPTIETNVNGLYIHHKLPTTSIFGGGDYQVFALQARYAVNDRLAIIATKDGYIDLNPKGGADEEGFANIAAGLKYAIIDDPDMGLLVTPGFTYEIDTGNHDVFQGNGDGIIRPMVNVGYDLGPLNVLGSLGWSLPINSNKNSTTIDYHLHLDYELGYDFYPLAELNGISYTRDGDQIPVNFEGGELINLGSTNVKGNTLITGSLGGRYRANEHLSLGFAYEWPLTSRRDLFGRRLTLSVLWRF